MRPNDATRLRFETLGRASYLRRRGERGHWLAFTAPKEMYDAMTMLAKERGMSRAQFTRLVVNRYLKSELELIGYEGW